MSRNDRLSTKSLTSQYAVLLRKLRTDIDAALARKIRADLRDIERVLRDRAKGK